MLQFAILDNEGEPADAAIAEVTGAPSPVSSILRLLMYTFQNDVLVDINESTHDVAGMTAAEVLLDIDQRVETYPYLHSVIEEPRLLIEPLTDYVVRLVAFVDGVLVPGSYTPPVPIPAPIPKTGRTAPVAFADVPAARKVDVPGANWDNGMNLTGTTVIGISDANPGLEQSLPSWTLEDQNGDPRTPQEAQTVGADTTAPVRLVVSLADGSAAPLGDAHLPALESGWMAV